MARARDYPSRLTLDWGAIAPLYDLQMPLERVAVRKLLSVLSPGSGERLLDLGTGTGAVLCELALRAHPPREVLGVDSSARMLQRVPPLPDGWRVTEADVTDLPLASGSVDVLSASYLLHVLAASPRRLALGEMFRVLRPGGRAGVLVPALPRGALRQPYASGLERLTRLSETGIGLSVIDAAGELERAGFDVRREAFVRTGYPSTATVAERPG